MITKTTELLDLVEIRNEFPILTRTVNGKPLVYLDNGATTQKPLSVIQAISNYYSFQNANIHRGVHTLSQEGTESYELSRKAVQSFIHASSANEVIFTKGTTDSINLVASSFGKKYIQKGDVILLSAMEHHSNIVPWQLIAEEKGARIEVIPMNTSGELIYEAYLDLLKLNPKIVAITHVSNSLGTINPVKQMISDAHQLGIPVLIDGAQAIQHTQVDVQDLDADFYVFSGHKMYGPTGIGILYGKEKWLNEMPPYQGGGDMIKTVSFAKTEFNELPFKFEAGTPNIEAAICLHSAVNYLQTIGLQAIAAHESDLLWYGLEKLSEIPEVQLVGNAKNRCSLISFNLANIHPYDAGVILDKMGIAVRTGHHCAQPVMDFFNIPGTIRASFALYNTREEIDLLLSGLKKAIRMLS
ncbi:MAG: cysteine desulfurase [Bacteroidia bacterium]|nr:cysteine desulfurase [Bacteroidia bacterium]